MIILHYRQLMKNPATQKDPMVDHINNIKSLLNVADLNEKKVQFLTRVGLSRSFIGYHRIQCTTVLNREK